MADHGHDHAETCGCGCGGCGVAPTMEDWRGAPDDRIVCHCHGLTKADIVAAIEMGAFTLPLVKTMTGAGRDGDCKKRHPQGVSCEGDIEQLVRIYARPPMGFEPGGCGC